MLAAIPLAKLRELGVLEPLMQFAGHGHASGSAQNDEADDESIDSMTVDDLVRAALDGQSDLSHE